MHREALPSRGQPALPTHPFSLARVLALLIALAAAALCSGAAAGSLSWPPGEHFKLRQHLDYLVDESGQLSAEQARAADQWQPGPLPRIAATKATIWVRFKLREQQHRDHTIFLQNNSVLYDHIQVFSGEGDGALGKLGQFGDLDPDSILHTDFKLSANSELSLYIRLQHSGALNFPIAITPSDRWQQHQANHSLITGAYYGAAFLLMLVYVVAMRRHFGLNQLFYLLAAVSTVPVMLHIDGFLHTWFPGSSWIRDHNVELFFYFHLGFWGLFARDHNRSSISDNIADSTNNISFNILALLGLSTGLYTLVGIFAEQSTGMNRIYPLGLAAVILAYTVVCSLCVAKNWRWFILTGSLFSATACLVVITSDLFGTLRTDFNVLSLRLAFLAQLFFAIYNVVNQTLNREYRSYKKMREAELINTRDIETNQLIHSMSANLRTPLSSIAGMVDLIRNQHLDSTQRHCIDVIERANAEITRIIDDMEDYNSDGISQNSWQEYHFNIEDCIIDSCHLFNHRAIKKNLELVHSPKTELPQQLVGDQVKIRKIISRLLANAVNNSRNGNIVIETTLGQASDDDKVTVVLWICNRIDRDNLDAGLALQQFFASDPASNNISGLEICRRLLSHMGGKLLYQQEDELIKVGFSIPLELAPNPLKVDNRSLTDQHCLIIAPKTLSYENLADTLYEWRAKVTHITSIDLIDKNYLDSHNFDCCIIDMDDPTTVGFINVHFLRELHSLMPPAIFVSHTLRQPDLDQENYRWQTRCLAKPLHYGKVKVLLKKLVLLKSNGEGDYISLSNKAPVEGSFNKPLPEEAAKHYKQQKVLVAEDNIVNRQVVHSLLNRLGISNTLVGNGIEATAALCEPGHPFTLVLMDCEMPEMDGYEATRLIRQYEKRKNLAPIPIIAVTSHSSRLHQEQAHKAGMSAFIRKPISLDVLRRELDKMLSISANNVVQIKR